MSMTTSGAGPDAISIEDHRARGDLFERYDRNCWFLYSPAIDLTGSRTESRIVAETQAGSLILYRLRESESRLSAQIFTPPIPCTLGALALQSPGSAR